MAKRKLSLSSRIFIYMIMLVVVASVLIAGVTIYQYNEQSQDYHRLRLERKEAQLISSINYVLKETTWEVKTETTSNLHHPNFFATQKLFSVKYQNQADVKVFVVDYANQA